MNFYKLLRQLLEMVQEFILLYSSQMCFLPKTELLAVQATLSITSFYPDLPFIYGHSALILQIPSFVTDFFRNFAEKRKLWILSRPDGKKDSAPMTMQ